MPWNSPTKTPQAKVRVLLTCGHWIRMRSTPWHKQKMGCNAGLGCGYQLDWIEMYDDHNRRHIRSIDDNGKVFIKWEEAE
jgi:hypothetical protein